MKKREIVNIINFIRGVEPRRNFDLVKPVSEQIRLMKQHGLKGTFLLQYDALIQPQYVELLESLDPNQFELGVWFEIVQPQVEACGLPWRGRFPWDWHTECGFSVGYTKEEREKLVDVLYKEFHRVFGYYPRVFGSWLFDTHTVRYVHDRYGIDALCNCKEQYGTDGYTLWGGYYGQAYYPSRTNVFLPAQTEENQIPVPLFRMLGSDPVYQYDYRMDLDRERPGRQYVISLEPVYPEAGGSSQWVNWYMKENFNGDCLTFGYAQAGQENAFGWDAMEKGLEYQLALFERLQREEKIEVETLGESGRWFKATYSATPPSAIVAHTAYDDEKKSSVWYSTKFYRVNLFGDHGRFRIRDLHLYSEKHTDPFENVVCTENQATYDALPVIEGNLSSGKGVLAGGYLSYEDGTVPTFERMEFVDEGEGRASVIYGDLRVELHEKGLRILASKPFSLENRIGIDIGQLPVVQSLSTTRMELSHRGTEYALRLKSGIFVSESVMRSEGNALEMEFLV